MIEQHVNTQRAEQGLPAIPFLLSDIQPHLGAWMDAAARSANLSFVPQPVDAADPPIAATSTTSTAEAAAAAANRTFRVAHGKTTTVHGSNSGKKRATANATADATAATGNGESSTEEQEGNTDTDDYGFSTNTRVFRLYCLSFHHFNDTAAKRVLESTLTTADGFAIVELQDRRVASLLLVALDAFLILLAGLFWFWRDPLHLILIYIVPLVPFTCVFDGFVSCLRTREFEEVLALVDGDRGEAERNGGVCHETDDEGNAIRTARVGEWVFEGGRLEHTWPLGHLNYVIGLKGVDRLAEGIV